MIRVSRYPIFWLSEIITSMPCDATEVRNIERLLKVPEMLKSKFLKGFKRVSSV